MKIRFDKCKWFNLNTYDVHASYFYNDDLHHVYNDEWVKITGFLVDYKHAGLTDPLNPALMELTFSCRIPEEEEPTIFRKQLRTLLEPEVRKMAAEDNFGRLFAWREQIIPALAKLNDEYEEIERRKGRMEKELDEVDALISEYGKLSCAY